MANILLIIPPERFRDEELFVTKNVLEKAGHKTTVASTKKGICFGSRGGSEVSVKTLDEINMKDYEGVVFVGGGGSKLLFKNKLALNIANKAYEKDKVLAAICLEFPN